MENDHQHECVCCGDVKQTTLNKHGKEVCEECYKVCCAECHGEFGEDCDFPLIEGAGVCAGCDPNSMEEAQPYEDDGAVDDHFCLRCGACWSEDAQGVVVRGRECGHG